MLSKQQFSDLIKNNFLWPGYNWYLRNTIDGLESGSNIYIDGIVEIFIDYMYNQYMYVYNFTNIIDINNTDSDKEIVRLRSKNSLSIGTIINIYKTVNYNGKYVITRTDDTNYLYINAIFVYEEIKNTAYYTIVSPDGYTESNPIYLDNYVVENLGDVANPVYLPLMGNKIGCKYSPSLSIENNRNSIKSAISIYRIKGSILSIKRVMATLGYDCEIHEPYKQMIQYGNSRYGDQSHYQDWKLYHDGVFEIITNGISINNYGKQISSLAQPAGTRLIGRANINLGLIPVIGDILYTDSNSYFTELYVQAFKYGNIFDAMSSDRTRSGRTELEGLYADICTELNRISAYRKIWDSQIFSFQDFAEPIINRVPAGSFSGVIGAYSNISDLVTGWTSKYDETTPLDVQLELNIKTLDERPARRSEFARRSGSESMSGLNGDNWTWKPYTFFNSDETIPMLSNNAIREPIELDVEFNAISTYTKTSGTVLDINRFSSGQRNVYGLEIILGHRYPTLEDWEQKIYWMFTDFTNYVSMDTLCNILEINQDTYNDSPIMLDTCVTNQFDTSIYLSGSIKCWDINITNYSPFSD